MNSRTETDEAEARRRLTDAYREEKPRLLARLRAAGRTLEEAEGGSDPASGTQETSV